METQMFSISNLKTMEVIDIYTGSKLGFIKDLKIDVNSYKIISIILPLQRISLFSKNNCLEIPWERIQKIGVDVILVDGSDMIIEEDEKDI